MTEILSKRSISAEAARKLIDAAESAATGITTPMCIAVVDESGILKAFSRMDGAPMLSVSLAQDKAYTAAAFGISTDAWYDFIKDDPPLLHGIVKTPRLIVFGGGYPITVEETTIGGIGVSGGHYAQDMQVAQEALKAFS